jgi:hypothetical protein
VLLAIISFMPSDPQGAVGSLNYSTAEREKLAKKYYRMIIERCNSLRFDSEIFSQSPICLNSSSSLFNKASDATTIFLPSSPPLLSSPPSLQVHRLGVPLLSQG